MDKQQSKPIESLSFEQLFQMAQEKFEELDYDQAEYFYSLAYNKNPFNEAVVMCYASILKQNDKPNDAKKILQKSIKDHPKGTYKRYFQLGEIYHGVQAIKAFDTGINQALKSLKNPFTNVTPQHQTKRDISQAYASIAEICMTDLIDQPQAQPKCIQALKKGNDIDPSCMDIHLQTANYQLWKENQQFASAQLNIIYTAVKQKKQEYDTQMVIQASKYFIELQQYEKSAQLLQTIHQNESNESEIVYLLAYCAFKQQKYDQCEDYIEEYQDGVNNIKDEEIEEAMGQLIVELKKFKKTNKKLDEKQGKNNQNDGEDFEDDEWMDVEDEEN